MSIEELSKSARACEVCKSKLAHPPNPIFSIHESAKILIIGQAPGSKVNENSIPWKDASGKRLRNWLGVSEKQFYDASLFALLPMGFCYPGKGKSGDLPPRPECAPLWHGPMISSMKHVELTVLIGTYAMREYLKDGMQENLTSTVQSYKSYLPEFFPIVHPSPRNGIWLRKNEWFEKDAVPELQSIVSKLV